MWCSSGVVAYCGSWHCNTIWCALQQNIFIHFGDIHTPCMQFANDFSCIRRFFLSVCCLSCAMFFFLFSNRAKQITCIRCHLYHYSLLCVLLRVESFEWRMRYAYYSWRSFIICRCIIHSIIWILVCHTFTADTYTHGCL